MSLVGAFFLGQLPGGRAAGTRRGVFAVAFVLGWVWPSMVGCGGKVQEPVAAPEAAVVAQGRPGWGPGSQRPSSETASAPTAEPTGGAPTLGSASASAALSAFQPLVTWTKSQKAQLYAALLDLQTNKWLVLHQADQAVNVASNAKVVTTAAALRLLGADYHFTTELFGSMGARDRCERLVIRGGGAPDLSAVDLHRFIAVLKGRGVTRVEHLVVDQSQFSGPFVPPAFEQQPDEWAPFRANISALSLDGNVVTLNVFPSRVGEAANVWLEPVGALAGSGQVMTSASGTGDAVSWQLSNAGADARLRSLVGGKLAVDAGRRRYQRRLGDPTLVGGWVFRELLVSAGIEVGEVQAGVRRSEERWAAWSSRPVAELVRRLGKDSDNFTAEMLLVALSSAAPDLGQTDHNQKPWSSARGAQVVEAWLKDIGLWAPGTVVKNGSGLFDANRYSPQLLVGLLAHVEDDAEIYYDFMSQLATGGTDGTLKRRMLNKPVARRIRAKTGTLREVDALTGYIVRDGGRPPMAFSLIVAQGKAAHGDVRARMDQTVMSWAQLADGDDLPPD